MSNILILGKGYISSKIQKYWSDDNYNLIFCSQSEDKYLTKLGELIETHEPKFLINCSATPLNSGWQNPSTLPLGNCLLTFIRDSLLAKF